MAKQNKQITGTFRDSIKTRLKVVSFFLFLFGAALIARLVFLQIIQHDTLVAQSEKQYLSTVKTHFGRGVIFDRNMNELARNVEVESVYVNPSEILDRKSAARILSALQFLSGWQGAISLKNILYGSSGNALPMRLPS